MYMCVYIYILINYLEKYQIYFDSSLFMHERMRFMQIKFRKMPKQAIKASTEKAVSPHYHS